MSAARLSPGAISESSSTHLPPSVASKRAKPVMFPPGGLSLATKPLATGSATPAKTRDPPRLSLYGNGRRGRVCQHDIGLQTNQLLRKRSHPIGLTTGPTKVDPHVAANSPTQARKRLTERETISRHAGTALFRAAADMIWARCKFVNISGDDKAASRLARLMHLARHHFTSPGT